MDWEYNYQLLRKPRTPSGRLRWAGWIPQSAASLEKRLPKMLIENMAPSGLVIDRWRWNDKAKQFEFWAGDGAKHIIRQKKVKP